MSFQFAKVCLMAPDMVYLSICLVNAFFFFSLRFNFYLFLAALGLRCCAWACSSCGEWRLLFIVVRGLLLAVASLVAEHGLYACGLQ